MKLWSRHTVPHATAHVHAMYIAGFLAVQQNIGSFFIVCYSYIFPLVFLLTVVLFL